MNGYEFEKLFGADVTNIGVVKTWDSYFGVIKLAHSKIEFRIDIYIDDFSASTKCTTGQLSWTLTATNIIIGYTGKDNQLRSMDRYIWQVGVGNDLLAVGCRRFISGRTRVKSR